MKQVMKEKKRESKVSNKGERDCRKKREIEGGREGKREKKEKGGEKGRDGEMRR
jgi:hypothetical protein